MYDFKTAEKLFWSGAIFLFLLSITVSMAGLSMRSGLVTSIGQYVIPLLIVVWGPFCRRRFSKT